MLTIKRYLNRLGEENRGRNKNAVRKIFLPSVSLKILAQQKEMTEENGLEAEFICLNQKNRGLIPLSCSSYETTGKSHKLNEAFLYKEAKKEAGSIHASGSHLFDTVS